jgi:hypothetical protein
MQRLLRQCNQFSTLSGTEMSWSREAPRRSLFYLLVFSIWRQSILMFLQVLPQASNCYKIWKSNSENTKENNAPRIDSKKMLDQQKNEKFTIHTMKKKASLNSELLLDPLQDDRTTHIMVTVGEEAIESCTLITNLIKMGTSIIRIKCAHGNPSV